MNNKHWYLHVDLDAFFASVEQLDHPEYRGKPVIVGGLPTDKRSVVSTASYEARKFGVHSAMPMWQAIKLCPNGIYVRGNHQRYAELSYKIMTIFKDFSPDVDQMSIDEAFIDLTGTEYLFGPPEETAKKIKEKVKEYTGLTVSVGLAPTKYLAKIASAMSKPDGFYFIKPGTEQDFMLNLPLEKVWGLGKKSLENLNKKGFYSTKEIFEKDYDYLEFLFGKNTATFLYNVVRGLDNNSFSRKNAKNHSISAETTFINDITDTYTIETAILELAQGVFFRLLRENAYSKTAFVKIRYDDFTTVSIQHTYEKNICTLDSFYEKLQQLFEEKYIPNRGVRLIGIGFENVVKEKKPEQQDLFETIDNKKEKVEQAILSMEQKNPKLKVQKARLIKKLTDNSKTKNIITLLFTLFFINKINSQALFNYDINDKTKVELNTKGSYEMNLEENLSFNLGNNSPFVFSPSIPVFKQKINLSIQAILNNKFFFDFIFEDEFKKNTISFKYKGEKYLNYLLLSNRNVLFPDYYSARNFGYGIQGGNNQSPGISLHFVDYVNNKWNADFVLRYDMLSNQNATFYGQNKVNDFQIPINKFMYGYSFVIPNEKALVQIKDIYVENQNGTIIDKFGKKYVKIDSSQYVIYKELNQIILSQTVQSYQKDNYIPTVIVTFSDASTVDTLISEIGSYEEQNSFLGAIQKYFNDSGKTYNLQNFSYNLKNQIENLPALVIQNSYGFSPFLCANFYDLGLQKDIDLQIISKTTDEQSNLFQVEEISSEDITLKQNFFTENSIFAKVQNEETSTTSLLSPQVRYPFAITTPEIYLNLQSDSDLELLARTYSPVSNYYIGTDAAEGTVTVFINGIIDNSAQYNSETGSVTLGKSVSNSDKIYITWSKDASDYTNGNVSVGIGFFYNFINKTINEKITKLDSDIALTTSFPILFKNKYSSYENVHSAFAALSFGINFQHNNFKIYDKTAISLIQNDISGIYLASTQSSNIPQTYYLSSNDGFQTKNLPKINVPLEMIYKNKDEPIIAQKDSDITGYKIPLFWNFKEFSSSANSNQYFWQSIDVKLSNLDNISSCSELEVALQPQIIQNSENLTNLSVYLVLGINANNEYLGEYDNLPYWELTNLSDKNVITQLDLTQNKWQTVKIKISEKDRIRLTSSKDARLIVVSKGNATSTGTIYFGPYQPNYQDVFTYSDSNFQITTEQVLDTNSTSTKITNFEDNYSTKINWQIISASKEIEDSYITAIKYFNKSNFNQYETINFDFAYNFNKKNTLTEHFETQYQLEFILDNGAQNAISDGNIAVKLQLLNISNIIKNNSETINYNTLTINTKTNEVYINKTKLNQSEYLLFINKAYSPNRLKLKINTVINNEMIENGNFYVNNVYFEGSKANVLLNNQFATEYNTEKTNISLVSNQSVDFSNASSPEINNDNSIVAKTELLGIIFGGDIYFDLSSNPQSNNGISNAGHTIKSKDKILNFFSFDETYRFEKSNKILAKENKISTNFYDFEVPILIDLSTIAKDTLYTQNQNTNLKLNFQIPIYKFLIDSTTNANVSQKAQKEFSQTPQIQNYQYFDYWLSTTKLAFSTGLSKAYSRTEEYEEKITVKTPYFSFTPDILINFKQNYNNQINAIHKDTTTIKINLPLTFKNNYFSFSWEKSISNNANTTTNGSYISDTKQLFASQQQNSWFYGVFPFADLFIKKIPNKINNLQNNVSKAYNSTYKLQWKRKLFNTKSDFYIPSLIIFDCTRDVTRILALNDIYQFKLQTTNTAITKYVDFELSLLAKYQIPNLIVSESLFAIDLYSQCLIYLEQSNKIRVGLNGAYSTTNNFSISGQMSWERPGKTSLITSLWNLIFDKQITGKIERKDTLNFKIGCSNNNFSQNYQYLHYNKVNILKYTDIELGCGCNASISEASPITLGILLNLGLKIEF